MTRKPEIAAIVPTPPRTFAPMQTAMPMMFGPGMNWQRLTMSANSLSLIQRRFSTAIRRAQTIPALKPQSETIRNAVNKAARGTARSSCRRCAISVITPSQAPVVGAFTRARAGGGDGGPDSADACAAPARAGASGYAAHQAARPAHAHVGDGCHARGDAHARAAHADAHGRAPRRGADRRQCPSAAPRPSG